MADQMTLSRRKVLGVAGAAVGTAAGAALFKAYGAPAAAGGTNGVNLYLSILSDAMTGKKNWPAYVPADLTVPAYTLVTVRIVNFDGGDQVADSFPYLKVSGVVGGTVTAQPLTATDPNAAGPSQTYSTLASDNLGHTFTVSDLNLNVPVPGTAIVTFTFNSGKPGSHAWQCNAPCGTDPEGAGGPMIRPGYMVGTLHVV